MGTSGDDNSYLHIIGNIGEGELNQVVQSAGVDQIWLEDKLYTEWPGLVYYVFHNGSSTQTVEATLKTAIPEWNEPKKYTDKDGKEVESVFSISKEMTFSMGKKSNLRPLVEGMVGRALSDDEAFEFDLDTLLGQSCVLNIIHDKSKTTGNPYSKIASAMPLMKGMVAPEAVNQLRIIDVATSPEEDINFLYDKLRDKMKSSKEWLERSTRQAVEKDDWYPTNENEGTAFDLPDDKLPN
jgi:hypothetical protein